jgi:hypothetical protein
MASCSDNEQEAGLNTGELLYLAMVIVSFSLFGAVLAYAAKAEILAARRAVRSTGRPR